MGDSPVEAERIQPLNRKPAGRSGYVLYWMQQAQRAFDNPALEHAVAEANRLHKPVLAVFGLSSTYPEANARHYTFLLEGLRETRQDLAERGIPLLVQSGHPPEVAARAAQQAALVVCDQGYLRHQRQWRLALAEQAPCRVLQVEGEVLVPTRVVSTKAEYAARTIRPKIQRAVLEYLADLPVLELKHPSLEMEQDSLDLSDPGSVLTKLGIKADAAPVSGFFAGGTRRAKQRFSGFLQSNFSNYSSNRNQPQTDDVSHMGMYLHFGQVSPVWLAREVQKLDAGLSEQKAAFLEELIVRRELAVNFTEFRPDYDAYSCLPAWAGETLEKHRQDPRDPAYTPDQLEAAQTHDPYWNAAMEEMKLSGYMHNYMRMYWGKQILKWSPDPREAHALTLRLNNKYFLDGRDPNSYAGAAWIYGVHDRGWPERPVFGKVRSMTAAGLERKCDIQGYVRKVEGLRRQAEGRRA